jgi:hypothetical protein
MGWVEMLEQKDLKELATLYVRGAVFENVLAEWARKRGGDGRTRSKTAEELKALPELLRIEIAEGALQMACDWNPDYRERTVEEWGNRLDTDVVLKEVLKICLDSMKLVVGTGIHTQFAWRFVWACVRKTDSGALMPEDTCLNTIVEYITNDMRVQTANEMGAVANASAGAEQDKRIRALLDATKEEQVQNLEKSLWSLTIQLHEHLTTYKWDKVNIDAKMKIMEDALVARVAKLEQVNINALVVRVAKLEQMNITALEARVAKLEQVSSTPVIKKAGWFGMGGNVRGKEMPEMPSAIGVLLGDLEKLSCAENRESGEACSNEGVAFHI